MRFAAKRHRYPLRGMQRENMGKSAPISGSANRAHFTRACAGGCLGSGYTRGIHVRKRGSMIRTYGYATATATAAALFAVAPAQASPPSPSCTQYAFNGEYSIRGYPESGETTWVPWTVTFGSIGTVASGPALVVFDDGGQVGGHVEDGHISGRKVQLLIRWSNSTSWYFFGVAGDDGLVRDGHEHKPPDHYPDEPMKANWNSVRPLDCVAPAAPEPPPPPDNTRLKPRPPISASDLAPENVPVTKTATVTGDADVYDAPGGNGKIIGVLRRGSTVQASGGCKPNDWCQVSGNAVPRGNGWVWGNLQF